MSDDSNLATALAKVQGQLTAVGKDKKANAGQYSYTYADLASVQAAAFPLMAAEGLAWMARPTWDTDGRFVLAYSLLHGPSGEREDGSYPLPDPTRGTPQQAGSAITYAKRYCLSAIVGVATEDDDGKAASDGTAPKAAARTPKPPAVQDAARLDRELRGKGSSAPADRGPIPPTEDPWANVRKPADPEWIAAATATVAGTDDLETLRDLRGEVVARAKDGSVPETDAGELLSLIDEAGRDLRAKAEADEAKALAK